MEFGDLHHKTCMEFSDPHADLLVPPAVVNVHSLKRYYSEQSPHTYTSVNTSKQFNLESIHHRTDRHTHTEWSDFILSTSDAGGNNILPELQELETCGY